jgi:hypothetical protein
MGTKAQAAQEALKRKQAKGRFKLPVGDTTFRVLPNARGSQYPDFVEYMVHYDVGPKHQGARCGKNAKGEGRCWLCDVVIPKLSESKDPRKKKLGEYMQSQVKEVTAVQIIYKDASETWRGPVLFEAPGSVAAGLLGFFARGNRPYTDPVRGYNFTITRTGTDKQTRYRALEPDADPSKIPSAVIPKIKPFGLLVYKYDEARQKAAYYGQEVEEAAPPIEEDTENVEAAEEEAALEGAEEVEEAAEEVAEEPVEEEQVADEFEEVIEEELETAPPPKKKPVKPAGKPVKKQAADIEFDEFAEEATEEAAEEEVVEETAEEEVLDETTDEPAAEIEDEFDFSAEDEPAPPPKKKPVAQPAKKPVAPPVRRPAPPTGKKPGSGAPAKKPVRR